MSIAEDLAKAPPWAVKIALGILLSLVALLAKIGVYDPWVALGAKVDTIDRKMMEIGPRLDAIKEDISELKK